MSRVANRQYRFAVHERWTATDDAEHWLRRLALATRSPLTSATSVRLLGKHEDCYELVTHTLAAARHFIHLETFVFWESQAAARLVEILRERAQAGVKVRVIIDWFGLRISNRHMLNQMEQAGVEVQCYRSPGSLRPWQWARLNCRTHRKIVVVDGDVAITGGIGIADQWFARVRNRPTWRDTFIEVRGPVVQELDQLFRWHWWDITRDVVIRALKRAFADDWSRSDVMTGERNRLSDVAMDALANHLRWLL